jgi:hypothetical protein
VIAPYWLAIKLGAGALLLALLAYLGHSYMEGEREAARQEVRDQYAVELAKAKDAAQQRERQLFERIITATEKGNQRESIATIRNGLPDHSDDALRQTASTLGELLASCEGRRRSVAEEAELLNSEKQTLIDAWPSE